MIIYRGELKFKREMNVLSLFHTIQKLKAGLSVLVDQFPEKFGDIRDLYFKNSTLYVTPEKY